MSNHANWMGDLLKTSQTFPNEFINKIIIPGTHDSGTYGMDTRARTQSLSIKEQLELGVRYFDCRVRIHDGYYYFHHTVGSDNVLGKQGDTKDVTGNILYDIRNFLIAHPNEILIFKFQNFSDFGHDDYWKLVELIIAYLEFNETTIPVPSKCALVTLEHGDAYNIGLQTVKTLNDSGKRVFLFFDIEDVPTDAPTAKKIWDKVFQYSPILQKGGFGLWDPYWDDSGSGISVNDTDEAHMEIWWDWHEKNREAWLAAGDSAGFYVLQSHMQVLHPTGNGGGALYFNIAEKAADGNYYMNQDPVTGDFCSNNTRNIKHYIDWMVKEQKKMNIVIFDYIQHGDVCDAIVDYYNNAAPPVPEQLHYTDPVSLKLNALSRYIGALETTSGYHYPTITTPPVTLIIRWAPNLVSANPINDGDEVMILTTESAAGNYNQLSVYKTTSLYYYNAETDHERWIIRNGTSGSGIKTGDYIWFENVSYSGWFLTIDGRFLTTAEMKEPTRWIIDKV